MNLLSFTTIPTHVCAFNKRKIGDETNLEGKGYKSYASDEFMEWMTTNSDTKSEKASRVYNSLKEFSEGVDTNGDPVKLSKLDFTKNHMDDIGENPDYQPVSLHRLNRQAMKLPNVALAMTRSIYLNDPGILTGKDMVELYHGFHMDGEEVSNNKEAKSTCELLANIDDSKKLNTAVNFLGKEQLLNMTNECNKSVGGDGYTNKPIKIKDSDLLKHKLERQVKESPINTTRIMNEIICQEIEPNYYTSLFLHKTKDWELIEDTLDTSDMEYMVELFEQHVREKTINLLDGRMGGMREELYYTVLPPRFRLKAQDSTPFIDIYAQHLLGVDSGMIRALYEICTFNDVKKITNSTVLLKKMTTTLKQIEKTQQNLLAQWGRLMWFVIYTELIRNTGDDLVTLKIKPTDKPEEISNAFVSIKLSLYHHKGHYYCLVDDKGNGFVSKDFRVLLARVHKELQTMSKNSA